MSGGTEWRWRFLALESESLGQPVQAWYDNQPEDVKDEIRDLIRFLRNATSSLWQRPNYDPLDGEDGISEIRPKEIRVMVNGKLRTLTPRIYGFFGPEARTYTFLHATNKKVKNDILGKRIAKQHLEQIRARNATVHEFNF
jgi:hypothetical protein